VDRKGEKKNRKKECLAPPKKNARGASEKKGKRNIEGSSRITANNGPGEKRGGGKKSTAIGAFLNRIWHERKTGGMKGGACGGVDGQSILYHLFKNKREKRR